MGYSTYKPVAVWVNQGRGFCVDEYDSRLDVVLSLLNSGSLGGSAYGSDEHKAALDRVEKKLAEVRNLIRMEELEEAFAEKLRADAKALGLTLWDEACDEAWLLQDFVTSCAAGACTDYDGSGYFATAAGFSREHPAVPSAAASGCAAWRPPSWATHVVWFAK